jgi:hypothetical protein
MTVEMKHANSIEISVYLARPAGMAAMATITVER